MVFINDHLEVIAANDIDPADQSQGRTPFDRMPKWGPQFAAVELPKSADERKKQFQSAFGGKEVTALPRYFATYEAMHAQIDRCARPLTTLFAKHAEAKALVAAEHRKDAQTLRWLPVKHRFGFWTALIDPQTAKPVAYIELDPH